MAKKGKGQIAFPEPLENIISREVVDTPAPGIVQGWVGLSATWSNGHGKEAGIKQSLSILKYHSMILNQLILYTASCNVHCFYIHDQDFTETNFSFLLKVF